MFLKICSLHLNSGVGRVINKQKARDHLSVELLLKDWSKDFGHLTSSIAASVSDSGVRVSDLVHDSFHDCLQVWLHLLVTSLSRCEDSLEGSMTISP